MFVAEKYEDRQDNVRRIHVKIVIIKELFRHCKITQLDNS